MTTLGWSEKEEKIDGISTRLWHRQVESKNQKALFIVHGLGEQSDRYQHFTKYLSKEFSIIAAVDLPGHGRSDGPRGHIEKFSDYTESVVAAFKRAHQQNPQAQWHWLGHSLGGLITIKALTDHANLNLKSCVLSAPFLGVSMPVPLIKKIFGRLVSPILGSIPIKNEIDATLLTHDPEVVKEYLSNPLNHNVVTPRFFVESTKTCDQMNQMNFEFNYSVAFVVPLEEKIVSTPTTLHFFKNLKMASGKKKFLFTFPGFYHESFNELGKERAFNAIADFFKDPTL